MRLLAIGAFLAACACETQTNEVIDTLPLSATEAYFTEYPGHLFAAAQAVCQRPGQSVVRPNANQLRCETFPDPESIAALILEYDGTVEDLPRFVIAFQGRQNDEGYTVRADAYINVPQKDGTALQLRVPNPEVTETFERLLQEAGGRPQ